MGKPLPYGVFPHSRGWGFFRALNPAKFMSVFPLLTPFRGDVSHFERYPRGMAENIEYRIEHDTMGEVRVPADALYRAQTQRAVENFPISGQTLESAHIRALALVKKAAATANEELKVLDAERAQAIRDAADLVATGKYDAHFPIDVFQTGSGTSSNMNANEVLATLATRSLESKGIEVHPNDHVNASPVLQRRLPHLRARCCDRGSGEGPDSRSGGAR